MPPVGGDPFNRQPGGSTPGSGFANQTQPAINQPAKSNTGAFKPSDISNIWPELSQTFPPEIDEEANGYFQQIYNQPPNPVMSVDEVLQMLKQFKDSQVKKEREVFMCMLRNLFEEYKFFPQYPERELLITACLFGGIIEQGLVTYMALGIALRYVLEALRKPFGSKMYYFGIAALDKFKTRLKDYPQYCQHLSAIQHFNEFPPLLTEYVKFGVTSREPPQRVPTPSSTVITAASTTSTEVTTPMSSVNAAATSATTTSTATVTKPLTKAGTQAVSIQLSGFTRGGGGFSRIRAFLKQILEVWPEAR